VENETNTTFYLVDLSLIKHKKEDVIDIITNAVADLKKSMEFEKRLEHKVQDIYLLDNFKGDWTNANESTIAFKLK
jgi:hypothetical protein